MKQLITILVLSLLSLPTQADNHALYQRLDSTLAHRNDYINNKEKKLKEIKLGAKYVTDTKGKLRLYESLANGYFAFVYDSAMTYTKMGIQLAQATHQTSDEYRFLLMRANLLISRGFYAEALEILNTSMGAAMEKMGTAIEKTGAIEKNGSSPLSLPPNTTKRCMYSTTTGSHTVRTMSLAVIIDNSSKNIYRKPSRWILKKMPTIII